MFWPLPYILFSSYSKLHREWTTSSQLSKPSEHVRQGGRYHADVEIWGPESRIWWKTGRFVMFFHCRTFYSSRSTKTYQELSTRWTVSTCLTRVQIPCGCSEQSGGPAGFWSALIWGKNEASVSHRLHPPWVEYRILTIVVRNTIDQLK